MLTRQAVVTDVRNRIWTSARQLPPPGRENRCLLAGLHSCYVPRLAARVCMYVCRVYSSGWNPITSPENRPPVFVLRGMMFMLKVRSTASCLPHGWLSLRGGVRPGCENWSINDEPQALCHDDRA